MTTRRTITRSFVRSIPEIRPIPVLPPRKLDRGQRKLVGEIRRRAGAMRDMSPGIWVKSTPRIPGEQCAILAVDKRGTLKATLSPSARYLVNDFLTETGGIATTNPITTFNDVRARSQFEVAQKLDDAASYWESRWTSQDSEVSSKTE